MPTWSYLRTSNTDIHIDEWGSQLAWSGIAGNDRRILDLLVIISIWLMLNLDLVWTGQKFGR